MVLFVPTTVIIPNKAMAVLKLAIKRNHRRPKATNRMRETRIPGPVSFLLRRSSI